MSADKSHKKKKELKREEGKGEKRKASAEMFWKASSCEQGGRGKVQCQCGAQ